MREKFRKTQGSPSQSPRRHEDGAAAAGKEETAAGTENRPPGHTDLGAAARQHGTTRPVPFLPATAGRATPEKAAQEREDRRHPGPHRSPRADSPEGKAAWRRPLQPRRLPPQSPAATFQHGLHQRLRYPPPFKLPPRGSAAPARCCRALPRSAAPARCRRVTAYGWSESCGGRGDEKVAAGGSVRRGVTNRGR